MNTLREIADDPMAVLVIFGLIVITLLFGVPSWINAYRYWRMSAVERDAKEKADELARRNPFESFRAIGETFQYCGRVCLVTSLSRVDFCIGYCAAVPELTADYSDNDGVIHTVKFDVSQLPALRAENRSGVEAGPGDVRE